MGDVAVLGIKDWENLFCLRYLENYCTIKNNGIIIKSCPKNYKYAVCFKHFLKFLLGRH